MSKGVLVEDIVSTYTKMQSSLRSPIELPLQGYTSENMVIDRHSIGPGVSCDEFLFTSTTEYIDKMRDISVVSDIDKHFNIQLRYTHLWEVHYNAEQMFLPLLPKYPTLQIQQLLESFQSNVSITKKLSKMKERVSDPKRTCNATALKQDVRGGDRCHFYTINTVIEAVRSMRCGYHVLVFDTSLLPEVEEDQLAHGKASSGLRTSDEAFSYITEASLIKLANRAGCLLLSKLCFRRLRTLLQRFLLSVVQFVIKKKVVLTRDVEYGLSRGLDRAVLGYGVSGLRHSGVELLAVVVYLTLD